MIPIPQYPIYSALITLLGGVQIGYELDESNGWGISPEELDRTLATAKEQGLNIKALTLINPGNPTGQASALTVLFLLGSKARSTGK